MGRRVGVCACCSTHGELNGRDLCMRCYMRHWHAGTLDKYRKPDPAKWKRGLDPRPTIKCVCCGELGPRKGRRLREACWERHKLNGTLERYPLVKGGEVAEARREEYEFLRKNGLSVVEAAAQLGVSEWTAYTYDAALIADGWCPTDRQPPRRAPLDNAQMRAAVLAHLARYPGSLFSAYELARVMEPRHYVPTVRRLLGRLADEGLVEVVDGQRDPNSMVPARRYRHRQGCEVAS